MAIKYANDFEAGDWWERLRVILGELLTRERSRSPVELDTEERRLLRAAAKAADKKHRPKARKKTRVKLPPVKVADFRDRYNALRKLGGKLVGGVVIFGEGEIYRMKFAPNPDGTLGVEWETEVIADRLQAELSKANRGLWDAASDRPGPEYGAIAEATYIRDWASDSINGIISTSPSMVAVRSALTDLLAVCDSPKLALARERYNEISASETGCESPDVVNLRDSAQNLALRLQRPPSRQELRKEVGWRNPAIRKQNRGDAEFLDALKRAGLRWLRADRRKRKVR